MLTFEELLHEPTAGLKISASIEHAMREDLLTDEAQAAVDYILENAGNTDFRGIAEHLGWSEDRTLKVFRKVGLSPANSLLVPSLQSGYFVKKDDQGNLYLTALGALYATGVVGSWEKVKEQ